MPVPDLSGLSQWEVRNHGKREEMRQRDRRHLPRSHHWVCYHCYGAFIVPSGPVPHAPWCPRLPGGYYPPREQDRHSSLRDLEAPFPVDDHWLAEDKRRRLLKGSGIPGLSVKNELGEEF